MENRRAQNLRAFRVRGAIFFVRRRGTVTVATKRFLLRQAVERDYPTVSVNRGYAFMDRVRRHDTPVHTPEQFFERGDADPLLETALNLPAINRR